MAPEFRHRKGAEGPWHFCTNCKDWPSANYESSTARKAPVCEQCQALERRQMCARSDAYL